MNSFECILCAALLSIIPLAYPLKPLFGWNNFFINNSAHLIAFITTTSLIVSFLYLIRIIIRHNGATQSLLKYFINKHDKIIKQGQKENILNAIHGITIYTIDKQDTSFQDDLCKFYKDLLVLHRKTYKNNDEGIEYPHDYYIAITKIIEKCVEIDKNKLYALQHWAISGKLLIPNDFREIKISEKTYDFLWSNVSLIRHRSEFIEVFWANSHQYFSFELQSITSYGEKETDIEQQREEERDRFLEFHYAMGGLLLYSKNYKALNYIFEYTQQIPPKYELLPYTKAISYFRNIILLW